MFNNVSFKDAFVIVLVIAYLLYRLVTVYIKFRKKQNTEGEDCKVRVIAKGIEKNYPKCCGTDPNVLPPTGYFVDFSYGDRTIRLDVTKEDFDMMDKGDDLTISYKGNRLISFK